MLGMVFLGFSLATILLLCYLYYTKSDCDFGVLIAEKLGSCPEDVLAGKVIWIIGASSGIGEFIAYELAKINCKMVLSARREEELERVKRHCVGIGKIPSDHIMVLPMNVLETNQHAQLFDQVLQKFNQLDILLNNAGRTQRARWEEISLEVDQEMFNLNVFSLISLTRVVLPHFIKRKSGHVVTMSSIAGVVGVPGSASYAAAKHALHGYMESLRIEKLRDNIAVTLLCPGPVYSQLLKSAFTGKPNEIYSKEWSHLDVRMETRRCAELCVIAIANHLQVAWISINPALILTYFRVYFPTLSLMALQYIDHKKLMKARDGRAAPKTEANQEQN